MRQLGCFPWHLYTQHTNDSVNCHTWYLARRVTQLWSVDTVLWLRLSQLMKHCAKQPTSDSRILSTQLLQEKISCASWSSCIGWIMTEYCKGERERETERFLSDCHCNDWSFETYFIHPLNSAQAFRLLVRVTSPPPSSFTVLYKISIDWLFFPMLVTNWSDVLLPYSLVVCS